MSYELEGRLLEVCTCDVLCPCWIGDDPDGDGTCQAITAWRIDKGVIDGVDVSGLTIANLAHIPGNILQGNIRVVWVLDDRATPQQQGALLSAWTGKLGGPLADYAHLVSEVAAVERLPVTFTVEGGEGRIQLGALGEAEMKVMVGATGQPTTLHDTIFSTIPGSPAYTSRATYYQANVPALGISLNLQGHNAIQGHFRLAV